MISDELGAVYVSSVGILRAVRARQRECLGWWESPWVNGCCIVGGGHSLVNVQWLWNITSGDGFCVHLRSSSVLYLGS